MTRFTSICIFAFLGGCQTLPDEIQDCKIIHHGAEEVALCEELVLKHEDRRAQKAELEAKRKACVVPNFWDGTWKVCREPQGWIVQ